MVIGNPELNFFDQNPELRYISEIKRAVADYSDKEASKILWAIYMIEDPNSKLYRIPKDKRIEEVKKNYYEIDLDKFKELSKAYSGLISMSKEERMFKVHVDKLDELTSYLQNLTLSAPDEFEKALKILEKLPKIWSGFDTVKTKLIESHEKTTLRAGAVESAREKSRK
jgi:hypothetical protein